MITDLRSNDVIVIHPYSHFSKEGGFDHIADTSPSVDARNRHCGGGRAGSCRGLAGYLAIYAVRTPASLSDILFISVLQTLLILSDFVDFLRRHFRGRKCSYRALNAQPKRLSFHCISIPLCSWRSLFWSKHLVCLLSTTILFRLFDITSIFTC